MFVCICVFCVCVFVCVNNVFQFHVYLFVYVYHIYVFNSMSYVYVFLVYVCVFINVCVNVINKQCGVQCQKRLYINYRHENVEMLLFCFTIKITSLGRKLYSSNVCVYSHYVWFKEHQEKQIIQISQCLVTIRQLYTLKIDTPNPIKRLLANLKIVFT